MALAGLLRKSVPIVVAFSVGLPVGSSAQADETPAEEKPAKVRPVCEIPELDSNTWLDRMHQAIARSVCGSAFWFDSFFGEEEADREHQATFGRIGARLQWSEYDELELHGRFKVKMPLPRFKKRINAFMGSYKEDEFETDRPETLGRLPEAFRETTDQDWLVGLGYSRLRGKRRRVDIDVGVRLASPLDPFVRLRFRRYRLLGDYSLLRFWQTLFWRGEKGLGTTSHIDLERALGTRYHLRWRNLGTVAEAIDGVDWESRLTLYQYLGGSRALAYEIISRGETDAEVTLKDYGLDVIYRQSAFRDWFFLEFRGGVAWPRDVPEETREASFGVGVGFELLFGKHP